MSSVIDSATLNSVNGTPPAAATASSEAGSEDRFLTLLVAQLQNQDPLNPMDNAQVTTQMAQISTVTGIEQLNSTVQSLNTQFVQMQALQGAALVGNDVTVQGNGLAIEGGSGSAGFTLAGAADRVKVEVLGPAGRVEGTVEMGALSSGTHSFEWAAPGVADGALYTFRVLATAGAASVASSSLMRDEVLAVSTEGGTLQLELARSGTVPYSAVKAFN